MNFAGLPSWRARRSAARPTLESVVNKVGRAEGAQVLGFSELKLLSALKKEGCPICHHGTGADREYFFAFLHDGYREPGTLAEMTESLGFCRAHGGYVLRSGEGRAQLAMVHEILVRRLRDTWLSRKNNRPWKRGEPAAGVDPEACPACRSRERKAGRAAFFLTKLIEDPATADRYGNPGALCLPHLQLIAPFLRDATLERLLALHDSLLASATGGAEGARSAALRNRDAVCTSALHLAVGHDRGKGPWPGPGEEASIPERPDPVRILEEDMSRADACPICREVRRAWLDWTAWLDAAAAHGGSIEDTLPTCPDHAWATLHAAGPALAQATADRACYVALMKIRISRKFFNDEPPAPNLRKPVRTLLHAIQGRRPFIRAARRALARDWGCPVCSRLNTARDRALVLLFALLEERGHRTRFERGYGLCLRHFARAMVLDSPPPVREWLRELQSAKLARLEWELAEYSRKRAWSARPETKGTEQLALERAVCRFSGTLKLCHESRPHAPDR